MTDTDVILSRLDDLSDDIKELTAQVRVQNGRVGLLEQWHNQMIGAETALKAMRDGSAWRLPAFCAALGGLIASVVSALLYITFT